MRGREPIGVRGRGDGRGNPSRGDGYHFDLPRQSSRNPEVGTRSPQRGESTRGNVNTPGRIDNGRTPGRDVQTNRGNTYGRTEPSIRQRQGQVPATRSENRTITTPNRGLSSGSRSSSGSSSTYNRGNSFSRSSSRATTGSSSPSVSRGGSVSRSSSGMSTRSGSSGGGSVSRGRR